VVHRTQKHDPPGETPVCTKGQHTRQARYRLQKELLITSSIAAEVFSALLASDPERARRSESVLIQHEKYRNDPGFSQYP